MKAKKCIWVIELTDNLSGFTYVMGYCETELQAKSRVISKRAEYIQSRNFDYSIKELHKNVRCTITMLKRLD